MRRIVIILVLLAVGAAIYFTLQSNKEKMAAATPKLVTNPSVPVRVIQLSPQSTSSNLSLTGTVQAWRDVMLLSETNGRITRMNADIGTYLPQGAVLLQVDDAAVRAAYRSSEVGYNKAKQDFERYQNLRKQNVGTEAVLDQYRAAMEAADAQLVQAREALNDKQVRMPFSGTLTSREVQLGSVLAPGSPIGNIVDISRLKVRVNVPEEQVFRMRKGSRATVTVTPYPGVSFPATVDAIGVKADASHTYPVDVIMANSSKNPLKAGMFARVEFAGVQANDALVIPREAIVGSSRDAKVYVVRDSVALLRPVELGRELSGAFVVANGLKSGDLVVVSGQINLVDSSRVTYALGAPKQGATAQNNLR